MKKCIVTANNGIGDQLVCYICAMVICKLHGLELTIEWSNIHIDTRHGDCLYSDKLFDIDCDIVYNRQDSEYDFEIDHSKSTIAISPLNIYLNEKITFDSLVQLIHEQSNRIKPAKFISDFIDQNVDQDIHNAYGIHLRHTDKIKDKLMPIFILMKISSTKYEKLINNLKNHITIILNTSQSPTFFVTSEDSNIEREFIKWIEKIACELNKSIKIIQKPDYDLLGDFKGKQDVIDMFLLSKCKTILSGTNFSNYSILAALLSKNKSLRWFHDDLQQSMMFHWCNVFTDTNLVRDVHGDIADIQYEFDFILKKEPRNYICHIK